MGITIGGAFESSLLKRKLNAPEEPEHADDNNRGFMDAGMVSMGEPLLPEVIMFDCGTPPQPTTRVFCELGGAMPPVVDAISMGQQAASIYMKINLWGLLCA